MLKRTVLCFLSLLVALPLLAALDGSLSGVVKDSEGKPLPGVTVTVTAPVLQGERVAYTKADGTFVLVNLPPGEGYRVVYSLSGFTNVERTGLQVFVGKDTQTNAALNLERVQAEVTVTAAPPVVDVTQTDTSQNFTSDYLRQIPIGAAGRSYQSILAQAPGVVGTANPNVMGGNILENSFLVDGINTTDPVTHTFTFNLNFDAIQEVNLLTSGYAAEYGMASGGVVNVVTKSGGNKFSGTADGRYSTNEFSEKGEHFDPNASESRFIEYSATLGGPILRDKVWFFANANRPDTSRTPSTTNPVVAAQLPGGPVSRTFQGWNTGLKISGTVSPQLNGFLEFQDSYATIAGQENSALVRREASSTQRQRAQLYTGVFDAVLASNWLAELQLGRFTNHLQTGPTFNDISVSRWTNRTGGGVVYDSYNNFQESDRDRDLAGLSSTYFVADLLGNHQFKAGVSGDRTEFPSVNITTGTPSDPSFCPAGRVCGATFSFNGFDANGNRIPFQQNVAERLPARTRHGRSYAAYVQDQWRPTSRLTLNLGVRFDRTEYYNNQDRNVVNFEKFQPRLGAAFDLLGDGTTVIRGDYGQFYVDAALTFLRLFDTGISSGLVRIFRYNTATRTWTRIQETGGQPVSDPLVDGELEPTYDEQANIALERQLFRGAAVTVGYVYKTTHDIFEDTCVDQTDCPDFWISNQPGRDIGLRDLLRKNYYGYMAQFNYSWRRGIVNANYVYSKSRGSINSAAGQYGGADFDHFPENFANRYGFLDDDARHRAKFFGSYTIPVVETAFAVNYTYRTGLPYTLFRSSEWGNRFEEPRGSSRTPALHVLDLQLEKRIPIGPVSFSVIGSVFNVLDRETPLTYFASLDTPAILRTPASYQRPRNYQVGVRAAF